MSRLQFVALSRQPGPVRVGTIAFSAFASVRLFASLTFFLNHGKHEGRTRTSRVRVVAHLCDSSRGLLSIELHCAYVETPPAGPWPIKEIKCEGGVIHAQVESPVYHARAGVHGEGNAKGIDALNER